MIITVATLVWFGLALLCTLALCRATNFTVPPQSVALPAPVRPPRAGGDSIPGKPASEPSAENAGEDPSVTPEKIESGLDWTIVSGISEGFRHAWWTCPRHRSVDAQRCRRALDERRSTVGQAQDWAIG